MPRCARCRTVRRNGYCSRELLAARASVSSREPSSMTTTSYARRLRREGRRRELQEEREVLRFVLGGDEHATSTRRRWARAVVSAMASGVCIGGSSGQTSLAHARRAGRRAGRGTWRRCGARSCTPVALAGCSTIAWSVSGLCGVLLRHELLDLVLDAARRDVLAVGGLESPDEKKYLSGSTPRGVCTNFSFVTRLTRWTRACPIASATSRSVSGRRYCTPFSKKSRCRSTMKCITLSIVCRRCSMAWIIQLRRVELGWR